LGRGGKSLLGSLDVNSRVPSILDKKKSIPRMEVAEAG
jgi:hypothetical protein